MFEGQSLTAAAAVDTLMRGTALSQHVSCAIAPDLGPANAAKRLVTVATADLMFAVAVGLLLQRQSVDPCAELVEAAVGAVLDSGPDCSFDGSVHAVPNVPGPDVPLVSWFPDHTEQQDCDSFVGLAASGALEHEALVILLGIAVQSSSLDLSRSSVAHMLTAVKHEDSVPAVAAVPAVRED